ncbi:MAG: hypothetical protein Q8P24_04235 [Desulfobacterales bacterium]|nr:hypothetical protein [Desulfobacterales bacterium]
MAIDLKDPEVKAAIAVAVEAAVTEAVTGLQAKNSELLGKLKKAQKDATIDPADHAALQADLDAVQNKLTEVTKALKTATTESDKIKKAYENESKVTHSLLVDNGLSSALLEAGVKKASYLKAAKAMLAGQVILTVDGESRIAKVGDKPLAEFVKAWAVSDEGKAFVDAPGNSGGGAGGGAGNGAGTGKTMTRIAFEGLDPVQKVKFSVEGGTLT